jgi:hypothetical protein
VRRNRRPRGFDSGLKHWPNNAGGRYPRASPPCRSRLRARRIGVPQCCVDPAATDAAYALSNLYLARGRFKEAADTARNFVTHRGSRRADGFLLFIRAATTLGNFDSARRTATALEEAGFPQQAAVGARSRWWLPIDAACSRQRRQRRSGRSRERIAVAPSPIV